MTEIPITQARDSLMAASPEFYADHVCELQHEQARTYTCLGTVITKTLWSCNGRDYHPIWSVCDLGNGNLCAARRALKRVVGKRAKRATYHLRYRGGNNRCLILSRMGEAHHDPEIRQLRENDSAMFLSILNTPQDDQADAKAIASVMREEFAQRINDPSRHFLGLFVNETLVGACICHDRDAAVVLNDVFVPREHRGHGYATRLMLAATALNPAVWHTLSCGSQNHASLAAAKKAGYTIAGMCEFE
ncbi:MAG: GNAT family N-acetyltransferase [Oscillospiraceae bacterium]|nr:GNAT family N-acetyltransferase [Oscillospiraceae bacterium]